MSTVSLKKLFFTVGLMMAAFGMLAVSVWAEDIVKKKNPVRRVAVVPFAVLNAQNGQAGAVRCPLCGATVSVGPVAPGAGKMVQEIFINKLSAAREVEIIPLEKTESVYKRISSESFKEPLGSTLKRVGQELKTDFIAAGFVYRYVERVGYPFSSERPASVAYEIHLLETLNGDDIWRGFFDRTQKSLMEDVLQISSFFRGGGKWLTAHQLAEQGMDEIFRTMPDF